MAAKKTARKGTTKKAATKKAAAKKVATKKTRPKKVDEGAAALAAKLIDAKIKELPDWQARAFSRIRRLIQEAVPDVVEEVKWRKPSNPMGVPVWSHEGILCTGETYKTHVKLTFAKGGALRDPARLFKSGQEGNARRALDLHEGDEIDESAFKTLVREAAALNASGRR